MKKVTKRKFKFKVGDRVRYHWLTEVYVITSQQNDLDKPWYMCKPGIGGLWEKDIVLVLNGLQRAIRKAKELC